MVRIARASRLFTQKKLSMETGISQGHISKFERGEYSITSAQLDLISKALQYPKSLFLQEVDFDSTELRPGYNRKRKTSSTELCKIQADITIYILGLRKLLNAVTIGFNNDFGQYITTESDPIRTARKIREELCIPSGPIHNLTGIIENSGGLVIKWFFPTKKLDAETRIGEQLPTTFFLNKSFPNDRLRFTLAHELAHVIMHRNVADEDVRNFELEADIFASEFLMPEDLIARDLVPFSTSRLGRLKRKWKVSMAALARRAKDLCIITESKYRRVLTEFGMLGYRTKEPVVLPPEEPLILNSILSMYQNDYNYTQEDLFQLLMVSKEDFEIKYLGRPPLRLV